jgi:hypothetical protein
MQTTRLRLLNSRVAAATPKIFQKMKPQKTTPTYRSLNSLYRLLLLTIVGIALSGCTAQPTQVSRLRVTNNGSLAIDNLIVRFPEDSIEFGDVPAGTTTEYKDVPNGVFSYAAYNFKVDDHIMTQPVIDWVGESPMTGKLFTYTIDFDPNRINTGDIVRLIDVKNDD